MWLTLLAKKKAKRQRRLKKYPLNIVGLLDALEDLAEVDLEKEEIQPNNTLQYFMARTSYILSCNRRVEDYVC